MPASGVDSAMAAVIVAGVSAFAATISAAIATLALLRTRRTQRAQQLYAVIQDWGSPVTKGLRRRSAERLSRTPPLVDREVIELLNFFETLGFMTNTARGIDVKACWAAFSDYLLPYAEACREEIDAFRVQDPTYYEELIRLKRQMLQLTERAIGRSRPAPPLMAAPNLQGPGVEGVSQDDVRWLLDNERTLPDDTMPLEANARITGLPTFQGRVRRTQA